MRKDINVTLGQRIWDSRKKLKMTREQLAEKINVSVRFLADVESGAVGVSLSTLKQLCDTLSVSADYLLGISEKGTDCSRYALLKKTQKIPSEHIDSAERIIDEILKISESKNHTSYEKASKKELQKANEES